MEWCQSKVGLTGTSGGTCLCCCLLACASTLLASNIRFWYRYFRQSLIIIARKMKNKIAKTRVTAAPIKAAGVLVMLSIGSSMH